MIHSEQFVRFRRVDLALPSLVVLFFLCISFCAPLAAQGAKRKYGTIKLHKPPFYKDRFDLSYYIERDGQKYLIRTVKEWEKRREHIACYGSASR